MDTPNSSFIDNIINGLRKAALELEEFQLQLSLGKADASDKYEEIKKKFHEFIHDAKVKLTENGPLINDLKGKFEELQLQLALGKADSKAAFKEQKIKILKALKDIEDMLKMNEVGADLYSMLNAEIEKFKIKMDILSLRFELGKMEVKDEFEARKKDFAGFVNKMKQKFSEEESVIEKNLDQFAAELKDAYGHLKKAFTKS